MSSRPSRQRYHVQTREPGGWVTRANTVRYLGAIEAAEGYADERGGEARVLLGSTEVYLTGQPRCRGARPCGCGV